MWSNGILEFFGVWINNTLPIMTILLFPPPPPKITGNLSWCCFLELLFDFWSQEIYLHLFFLSLAFRSPPRSLYNFIFNRQESCPVLLTLACLISFSSSQVPHFNRFLLLCILPRPLKLLPLTWKPTLLYSISLFCWGWNLQARLPFCQLLQCRLCQ